MDTVVIVVLGDVSHSPRMLNHALAYADAGVPVTIIGYKGGAPPKKLTEHERVTIQCLYDCPDFKNYLPGVLAYIFKCLWQSLTLLLALILSGLPTYILVQNPPGIPALGVCWFYSRLSNASFIIDWHNYAHTILALSLGPGHSLVRFSGVFEFFFGRRADFNFCVTNAMVADLADRGVHARRLYDRPPDHFRRLNLEEKHALLRRLGLEHAAFVRDCGETETVLTCLAADGSVTEREGRPGLLISSTSWTQDEDFSLLLDALQVYEDNKKDGQSLPPLLVFITGKGPLKEFYAAIISRRQWRHVQVITPWLAAEDYPKLLGCGDLGVCLHTSSSGLDLPMKVVDMFGCGLPVAAVGYKCLDELVQHKQNGLVFNSSEELAAQLQDWFLHLHQTPPEDSWRRQVHARIDEIRAMPWQHYWRTNYLLPVTGNS